MSDVNNLITLNNFEIENIQAVIKERFQHDIIYTKCGRILISLNPFKDLGIHDEEHLVKYHNSEDENVQPHVFQFAETTYQYMLEEGKQQAILISGESGAGKTEISKHVLRKILYQRNQASSNLEDKINMTNFILESFGNAKTILNWNSSRFGKLTEIFFDEHGKVRRAIINEYMLEKSRLIKQNENESNFHILYAFFEEANVSEYQISKQKDYKIFSHAHKHEHPTTYQNIIKLLKDLDFNEEDINNMQKSLAAILHITEIEFDDSNGEVYITTEEAVSNVAELMSLDLNQFRSVLLEKTLDVPDGTVKSTKSKKQSEEERDAFAKSLYARLFAWIIAKMNSSLSNCKLFENLTSINMLDMSGFESLEKNSFEQFVINFTNEKLQSYLEKHIFALQMALYKDEEVNLPFNNDKYQGNEEILYMFEKLPTSLLSIIDEETHFPESNNDTLFTKLNTSFGKYKYYEVKDTKGFFAIQHFAGKVTYEIDSFLLKNKDELYGDLKMCVKQSRNEFFSRLFKAERDLTGSIVRDPQTLGKIKTKSDQAGIKEYCMPSQDPSHISNTSHKRRIETKRTKTVISYMKNSLCLLVKKLNVSEIHFIRCIRPNDSKMNNCFKEDLVKKQLLYTGIAHAAEIYKVGYPYRKSYSEFINSFSMFSKNCKSTTEKENVKEMLEEAVINSTEYHLGKNMIFMKDSAYFAIRKEHKALLIERESETAESVETAESAETAEDAETDDSADTDETDFTHGSGNYTIEPFDEKKDDNLEKEAQAENSLPLSGIPMNESIKQLKLKSIRKNESYNFRDIQNESYNFRDIQNESYNFRDIQNDSLNFRGNHSRVSAAVSLENIDVSLGLRTPNRPDIDINDGETKGRRSEIWDIFDMFEEDPERDELQHSNYAVLAKLFLYLLFFLIILASSIIQKLTLCVIANVYFLEKIGNQNSNTSFSLLSIAICIPYGIGLIISIHKFAFSSEKISTFSVIIMALLPETFHSIGLCVFLFDIFPRLDIPFKILILSSVGIVPGLFKLLFTHGDNVLPDSEAKRQPALSIFKNLSMFICQVGALIASLYFTDDLAYFQKIEAFICMVLISISSWENFTDECRFSAGLNEFLRNIKSKPNRRAFANIMVYIWKILLTLLIGYLFTFQKYGSEFEDLKNIKQLLISPFLAVILLTICTAFGYYISYQSCSLRMQIFCYSLSLLLSTPLSLAGYFILYHLNEDPNKIPHSKYFTMNKIIAMACGGVIYISFHIIVSHIWHPKTLRLQKYENLFQKSTYCSVFYEQNLLLDRKRNTLSKKSMKSNDIENPSSNNTETFKNSQRREENEEKIYPRIYACATMWHENQNEMMQLLKSLFRMSMEHTVVQDVKNLSNDDDYYDFEAHIFIDDAMDITEDENIIVNKYVETLVSTIDKAASSVMKSPTKMPKPCKLLTPYGGQLLWELQENVLLFVHLKDKNKIRNKKRWSQVMYMYYLLGHRLPNMANERVKEKLNNTNDAADILNDEINKLAENTFILALDGDVEFQPDAVEKLLDLMKHDDKLGAACGRIHPMGKGPIIWFQIFEYAIGHWYQKATEHVLGCVLCSPGCFSLFRGSALMDMNVARKYAILPTEPQHYLQFDQGEDRWLCTLLLQQGYKIGYCAASDAYTFAPETFNEFFNQRRRWMPSTMANIMDLLSSYKLTIQKNDNVSVMFIVYQLFLMVLTIIGPSTVMMMIAVAIDTVFLVGVPLSYLLVLIPNILFVICCFYLKTKTQLILASFQSATYTFIMLAVIVGVIIQAVQTSILNPGVIIIVSMSALITASSLFHLQEIYCLIAGFIYFLCIPLAYLILVIYSMCNMHVVSWGTREVKQSSFQKAKAEEIIPVLNDSSLISKINKMLGISELSLMIKKMFSKNEKEETMLTLLKEMNENIKTLSKKISNEPSTEEIPKDVPMTLKESKSVGKSRVRFAECKETQVKKKGLPDFWIKQPSVGNGKMAKLSKEEHAFWQDLINKYLYPLRPTLEEEQTAKDDLLSFRTSCCFALILLNLLWMVINFMFQYRKPFLFTIPGPEEDINVEIFSFLFLVIFAVIFVVQFIGMLLHRLETLFHIISCTDIINDKKSTDFKIPNNIQKRILRELRYSSMREAASMKNSASNITNGFQPIASAYITRMSTKHNTETFRETLRRRTNAIIISEGETKEDINRSLIMSRNVHSEKTIGKALSRVRSKKVSQQIKSRAKFIDHIQNQHLS